MDKEDEEVIKIKTKILFLFSMIKGVESGSNGGKKFEEKKHIYKL